MLARWVEIAHSSLLKARFLDMYIVLVPTQRGHGLTTQEAATLIQLAKSL
jgi:hypothetical protein